MDKKYFLYVVIGGFNRPVSVERVSFELLITDLLDDGVEIVTNVSDYPDHGFRKTNLFVDGSKIGYFIEYHEI